MATLSNIDEMLENNIPSGSIRCYNLAVYVSEFFNESELEVPANIDPLLHTHEWQWDQDDTYWLDNDDSLDIYLGLDFYLRYCISENCYELIYCSSPNHCVDLYDVVNKIRYYSNY